MDPKRVRIGKELLTERTTSPERCPGANDKTCADSSSQLKEEDVRLDEEQDKRGAHSNHGDLPGLETTVKGLILSRGLTKGLVELDGVGDTVDLFRICDLFIAARPFLVEGHGGCRPPKGWVGKEDRSREVGVSCVVGSYMGER